MYEVTYDTQVLSDSSQNVKANCNNIRFENKGNSLVTVFRNITLAPGQYVEFNDGGHPDEIIKTPFSVSFDNENTAINYSNYLLVIRKYTKKIK